MDNEFILQDRIQKIQQIITKYGEENFYIAFSGGKDSTVLHHLIDMAIPKNNIPRVYCNTGIELKMIQDFVTELWCNDDRIVTIRPSVNIRETLETYGYPFKSKKHSKVVKIYQKYGTTQTTKVYLGECPTKNKTEIEPKSFQCPDCLRYQFNEDFKIKISDACCYRMKEQPMIERAKRNNKLYSIIGIRSSEGGRRMKAKCLAFENKKLKSFQPLVPINEEWEEWFINEYDIKICDIYKPPFNFNRTGCKGCPFAIHLQSELDILETFFPAERKQCELIWKPVYDEYRRINYRLKGDKNDEGNE